MLLLPKIYLTDEFGKLSNVSDDTLLSMGINPQYLVDGDTNTGITFPPEGDTKAGVLLAVPRHVWTKVKVTVMGEVTMRCSPSHLVVEVKDNSITTQCVSFENLMHDNNQWNSCIIQCTCISYCKKVFIMIINQETAVFYDVKIQSQ